MMNILSKPVRSCTQVICNRQKKKNSHTKQSIVVAPVYRLEYQLYKNLPNFTGVYVIFQISILADLFHLWGMKKNTSVVAKAQL